MPHHRPRHLLFTGLLTALSVTLSATLPGAAADMAALDAAFRKAAHDWGLHLACTATASTRPDTSPLPILDHEFEAALKQMADAGIDAATIDRYRTDYAPAAQMPPGTTTLDELLTMCRAWPELQTRAAQTFRFSDIEQDVAAALADKPAP